MSKETLDALAVAAEENHSVFCLEQLGVTHRIINLLYDSGIKDMGELLARTPEKILEIPNFGKGQLRVVMKALAKYEQIEDL